jgi:membrane protein DedA with SNARE-associated domain
MMDSSPVGDVPFGTDAIVILLAAKHREIFWVFPPIVTTGSLVGAALTYWVGRRAGGGGLSRLVPPRHLERVTQQLQRTGVAATAAAAVLPPPFPLTPFLLTCGALDLDRWRFFLVFGAMRLVRFGALALLARQYGERVLQILESDRFQAVTTVIVVVACVATIASAITLWRRTRPQRRTGLTVQSHPLSVS